MCDFFKILGWGAKLESIFPIKALTFYLNFQLPVAFSLPLALKMQFLLFEQNSEPYQCLFFFQNLENVFEYF